MNYTFIELIKSNPDADKKEFKIVIPQIQRDYAQGRKDKDNEYKIKSCDFVLKLIIILTTDDNPALNLDFVYGYTESIGKEQFAFVPLDGQQRLTTLWLLHWYLAPKIEREQEGIKLLSVSDEIKSCLKNFTYETRNSSKRFCEELINESLPSSDDICATIKDANWFMASWLNDPTVVSMLNMLETIQKQNFDKSLAWENLIKNRKITFDYIDIKSDEFKLTDELYIKMNSRGKPLTVFENFKAQFSEILSAKDTDYVNEKLDYEGTQVSFQEYFAFKIDSVWTDLFWTFAMQQKRTNFLIDYCLMNFFTYIAQMCYYKDNTNQFSSDFKNDFSVFKKKNNILFLFNALDWFYKISIGKSEQVNIDNITTFFRQIFQDLLFDDRLYETYQGEVSLFKGTDNRGVNLFEKCLLEGIGFDNRVRIVLYCFLSYIIKYQSGIDNNELRYYIRVVRNLLQATRQRNEIVYNTNVRINAFGKYWKLFEQLLEKPNVYECLLENIDNKDTDISNDALNNEKEKAQIVMDNITNPAIIQALFKLEEYKHFGGLIHNLKPQSNVGNFINYSEYIREIWTCKDYTIIASLIACDFGGFYTKDCRLGGMWFWGKGDNWNTILAGQVKDDSLSNPLIKLLTEYGSKKLSNPTQKPQEILESIISEFLDSSTDKNWQYYFCKYRKQFLLGTNYYSWNSDEFEQ